MRFTEGGEPVEWLLYIFGGQVQSFWQPGLYVDNECQRVCACLFMAHTLLRCAIYHSECAVLLACVDVAEFNNARFPI